jgi:hypothetical protein
MIAEFWVCPFAVGTRIVTSQGCIVELPEGSVEYQEAVQKTGIPATALQTWLGRFAMILLGIVLALLLIEGLFRLFPRLRPDDRVHSADLGNVHFTAGIGDLFIERPGSIAPPPDPYQLLSEHRLAYDADGFRIPERPAAAVSDYAVIALGDSYTEGANVAHPWPDVLAEHSGLLVRNLGFRGYGPAEEAHVLQNYGTQSNARFVILGYFEGNDLYDMISSGWRGDFVLPSIVRRTFAPFDPQVEVWKTDHTGPFQYPIQVEINGNRSALAFFDNYLSWLNADEETYAQSENLREFGSVLQKMRQSAGKACFVLAYFPDKSHIYAPYVLPADQARVMSTLTNVTLDKPKGELVRTGQPPSYESVLARLDNQRDAVTALAAQQGVPLIDLVPAFKAGAARGEILYYTYDTHWNQAGQALAGSSIADFLASNPCAAH